MRRTMIMPIVFGILTMLIAVGYALVIILIPIPLFVKIIFAAILAALIIAMVFVLIQRNRELKQEESIDISKY